MFFAAWYTGPVWGLAGLLIGFLVGAGVMFWNRRGAERTVDQGKSQLKDATKTVADRIGGVTGTVNSTVGSVQQAVKKL